MFSIISGRAVVSRRFLFRITKESFSYFEQEKKEEKRKGWDGNIQKGVMDR